jgi:dTDP-glucose 4,6-dehydratase
MTQPLPNDDLEFIQQRTECLWEELRGQRIFITGGTGFFGVWLLESLLHANRVGGLGLHATVLSRSPEAFRRAWPHLAQNSAITLLGGDVRSFVFPEGEFKFVIHAATETYTREGSGGTVDLLGTILGGAERVLQFAAHHGTEKLLLTSSGAVYGPQPEQLTHLREDYPGAPDPLHAGSAYAEGKRAAEALCVAYGEQYGMACKIARCFAFVGPLLPLDAHFAIGNFIRDAMRGEAIRINGDGTARRSYMYSADLAIWIWNLLLRAPAQQAFNVGSAHSVSILELANTVRTAIGSKEEVRVAKAAVPGAPLQQYVPCVEKAASELGLCCEVSLEDAIRKTAAWHGWV